MKFKLGSTMEAFRTVMILLVALTYGFMFGVIQSYNKMQYSDNRGLRHAGKQYLSLDEQN